MPLLTLLGAVVASLVCWASIGILLWVLLG